MKAVEVLDSEFIGLMEEDGMFPIKLVGSTLYYKDERGTTWASALSALQERFNKYRGCSWKRMSERST